MNNEIEKWEENTGVPELSVMDQCINETGEWFEQEISKLPPEEREAVETKLVAKAEEFGEILDKTYEEAEKFCNDIIDSLDRMEKWLDRF